jgi:shikimate kinase
MRNGLYSETAHYRIDNSLQTPKETVDEIMKNLQHIEKGDR